MPSDMKFPKNPFLVALAACIGMCVSSCNEDVTVSLKTYSTYDVTNTSVSVSGKVDIVGSDVVESGFLMTSNSSIATLKYTNTTHYSSIRNLNDVRVTFTGLSADTSYRYRLYARTTDSIYYGSTYSFYPGSVVLQTAPVPAGTFSMGGTSEQSVYALENEFPVHQVTLKAFNMGVTEVTNAQFLKFLRSRKVGSGGTGLTADGVTKTLLNTNLHGLKYNADSAAWTIG